MCIDGSTAKPTNKLRRKYPAKASQDDHIDLCTLQQYCDFPFEFRAARIIRMNYFINLHIGKSGIGPSIETSIIGDDQCKPSSVLCLFDPIFTASINDPRPENKKLFFSSDYMLLEFGKSGSHVHQ